MQRLFVVVRSQGAAWKHMLPLAAQDGWQAHAEFMEALHDTGFVVLGGPLEGTPDVLLIVRATDAGEITSRLAADPWSASELLRLTRIAPWTLRLGALG